MKTSESGVKFIEVFEGFRGAAYRDSGGIWTCGYGHTHGVNEKTICTQEQAEEWLKMDLATAERLVNSLVAQFVDISQSQFDALVSLVFNIGGGAFSRSTLLMALRAHEFDAAAAAFLMWDKVNGKVVSGLENRRKAERKLFLEAI